MQLEFSKPNPTNHDILETLKFAARTSCSCISIVDKRKDENNLELVSRFIKLSESRIEIMPHYCIKNHYNRSYKQIVKSFLDYSNQIKRLGINDILVVSGSPKNKFTTTELLNQLATNNFKQKLSVAYTPSSKNQQLEDARIIEKLRSPLVSKVYFQISDTITDIRHGVEIIRSQRDIPIFVTVMAPSKQFLSNFSFRPWTGAYLSKEYLSSEQHAINKTKAILKLSKELQLHLYLGASPYNVTHLEDLADLATS